MSESKQPTLSQYFGTDKESDIDAAKDLENVSDKINNIRLDDKEETKNEPEICRIFMETPPQPKDPTAAFFDLIGNPATATAGIVTELGLSNADVRKSLLQHHAICILI